jgi:predicted AAA+ superfamily ATPase
MSKNEIIEILKDWNFWDRPLDCGITRPEYLSRIRALLESRQVISITGCRRSGKSYLMRQAAADLIKSGVDSRQILMVNFEDPRFSKLDVRLLQDIYEAYTEYMPAGSNPYIFLDEIQEVEGWERWVRTFHELKKAKVCISGSNAKLLSHELGTVLTGRHLDLTVFPLSFKEFLSFRGLPSANSAALREYLEIGGFPEAVSSAHRQEILLSYFEDILNKDLLRRFRVRKAEQLKSLAKYYLSNNSSQITFNSFEKSFEISANTAEKFSGYLEDAYLVLFLKRFSFKVKVQEKSPRKAYCIDTGLANSIGFRFSRNWGRLAEAAVFLELKRRQFVAIDSELYYWKDPQHREVDFIVKEGVKPAQAIQVCWQTGDLKTKEREVKGLLKAMAELSLKEGVVITEEHEEEQDISGRKIRFIPLVKWL